MVEKKYKGLWSIGIALVALLATVLIFVLATGGIRGPGSSQLRQLLREYNAESDKLKNAMLKTHSREYVNQHFVLEAPLERLEHFGPRFLAVADEYPGTDVAWMALRQVAYIRGFSAADKMKAMTLLTKNHISRSEFADDLYGHHYRPGVDANQFYRIILSQNHVSPRIAGLAKFSLAVGLSGTLTNDESISEENRGEALRLLQDIQQQHANQAHPVDSDKRTLGEAATDLAFQLKKLTLGQKATEITGETVDGQTVHLSDYAGNVVLLVFCGEWCGPCRAMYPHEISMVNEFGERGFSILGINSDPKETLKEAITRERFPWKWIWDGGSPNGPIATRWGINLFPSFVICDRNGVIRKRKFSGETIEEVAESIRLEIAKILDEHDENQPVRSATVDSHL